MLITKIILMSALCNLQKRNNVLKSKLLHEKLKYGNYQFNTYKKELLLVFNAYKTHKSLIKAADSVGVDKNVAIGWFIQGFSANPQFRGFYLGINHINRSKPRTVSPQPREVISPESKEIISSESKEVAKNYTISEFLNSCTYTTVVDGEKISIISRDLDTLKQLVRSKNLPID